MLPLYESQNLIIFCFGERSMMGPLHQMITERFALRWVTVRETRQPLLGLWIMDISQTRHVRQTRSIQEQSPGERGRAGAHVFLETAATRLPFLPASVVWGVHKSTRASTAGRNGCHTEAHVYELGTSQLQCCSSSTGVCRRLGFATHEGERQPTHTAAQVAPNVRCTSGSEMPEGG